ncbi:uncharacterized protein LOC113238827, partial [Hyposmocoma kahamanoa]|uniref:uncharacterized protein LOC113238827 n=1 Tax=Hyposmocoma kahamanoa TaxID=1477025 RepID=UPI000E6D6466
TSAVALRMAEVPRMLASRCLMGMSILLRTLREVTAVPRDIGLIHIGRRNFTVTWRCYEAEASDEVYVYMVCARMVDGNDKCQESKRNSATFEGLQPNTVYEVRVQARIPNRALGGPFSPPYTVTTLAEGPQRFKDLKGVFINSTTLHVSWNGPPGKYTVRYSTRLWLPVEQWTSVQTDSNNVLIHDVEPADKTYVMVIGYNPPEHSQVETITPGKEEVHYKYTRDGILVWWTGQRPGAHVIRYEQNITRPLEQWRSIVVPQSSIELTDLNPDLPTYVMVSSSKGSLGEVLNIAPRPQQDDNSAWYLAVGIPCGLFVLCLLAVAAVCLWRRRKMARSPRQRRRNASPNDGNAEEGAEMK